MNYNTPFPKTNYGLVTTENGEIILTANGHVMSCPEAFVEQTIVQPKVYGDQPKLETFRRPCTNACPKFRAEYVDDVEGAVVYNDCCPGAPPKKIEAILKDGTEQEPKSNLTL